MHNYFKLNRNIQPILLFVSNKIANILSILPTEVYLTVPDGPGNVRERGICEI